MSFFSLKHFQIILEVLPVSELVPHLSKLGKKTFEISTVLGSFAGAMSLMGKRRVCLGRTSCKLFVIEVIHKTDLGCMTSILVHISTTWPTFSPEYRLLHRKLLSYLDDLPRYEKIAIAIKPYFRNFNHMPC